MRGSFSCGMAVLWIFCSPSGAQEKPDAGAKSAKKPIPTVKRSMPPPAPAPSGPPPAPAKAAPAPKAPPSKAPRPPAKEDADQEVIDHLEMLELWDLLSDYDLFDEEAQEAQ